MVFHPIFVLTKLLLGAKTFDKVAAFFNLVVMRSLNILGTKYIFKGIKKLPTQNPIVFISNHQSMWDIPPLMWKYRIHRPKFVAKKELARFIPSVSFNINFGGSVAINRKKPKEALKKIKEFALRIKKQNYSVCIFPEGTRSKDGSIKPFKFSGIEAILKEIPNAVFVPVAIKNTQKIDIKGKFYKRLGVNITFTQLAPRTITLENAKVELEKMRLEMIPYV